MSGLVNKIKNFVGLYDEEDIYDDLNEADEEYEIPEMMDDHTTSFKRKSNLKVLTHPTANSYEVMVIEPRSFEESLEIVNNLREKKSIILNLHLIDAEQSQRLVDFLSGATHAIDGNQQKIGEGVFIFTPCNVSISSETEKARVMRDAFWTQAR